MRLRFKWIYLIGIVLALAIIGMDVYAYFYVDFLKRFFWPILIIAINIGWSQFWIDFYREIKRQKEIENQFLEFMRSLVGSVKSGIDIPKSILNVADKNFGDLTPYVKKLANQIEWGIPVRKGLLVFGRDTDNKVIQRSIAIIIEADASGGDLTNVLTSVTKSVLDVKKMKEERRTSAYSQIVQGYIVFFVFIAIMLILQLWLFPKLTTMQGSLQGTVGGLGSLVGNGETMSLDKVFLGLILIQGFFAGIMIGKFSEGTFKQGLIHSLVLMTLAAVIITTAKGGLW